MAGFHASTVPLFKFVCMLAVPGEDTLFTSTLFLHSPMHELKHPVRRVQDPRHMCLCRVALLMFQTAALCLACWSDLCQFNFKNARAHTPTLIAGPTC